MEWNCVFYMYKEPSIFFIITRQRSSDKTPLVFLSFCISVSFDCVAARCKHWTVNNNIDIFDVSWRIHRWVSRGFTLIRCRFFLSHRDDITTPRQIFSGYIADAGAIQLSTEGGITFLNIQSLIVLAKLWMRKMHYSLWMILFVFFCKSGNQN